MLREVLENAVEFRLFGFVDVVQESAELAFKVMPTSKVIVAALFVRLEEFLAQVAAFEAFVDGLGAETASAHGRGYSATRKRVRVVCRIADEGKVVERVFFENARNGNNSAYDVVDSCFGEELVQPFHGDIENVPVVFVCNPESGTEVRDVGFDFRETPDVPVVDKVMALPEREIVGAGEDALHLDIDSGAGDAWLLDAVETDLPSDAAFDAVCRDDHFCTDFFGSVAGSIA